MGNERHIHEKHLIESYCAELLNTKVKIQSNKTPATLKHNRDLLKNIDEILFSLNHLKHHTTKPCGMVETSDENNLLLDNKVVIPKALIDLEHKPIKPTNKVSERIKICKYYLESPSCGILSSYVSKKDANDISILKIINFFLKNRQNLLREECSLLEYEKAKKYLVQTCQQYRSFSKDLYRETSRLLLEKYKKFKDNKESIISSESAIRSLVTNMISKGRIKKKKHIFQLKQSMQSITRFVNKLNKKHENQLYSIQDDCIIIDGGYLFHRQFFDIYDYDYDDSYDYYKLYLQCFCNKQGQENIKTYLNKKSKIYIYCVEQCKKELEKALNNLSKIEDKTIFRQCFNEIKDKLNILSEQYNLYYSLPLENLLVAMKNVVTQKYQESKSCVFV
ncbi:hypothetical protein AB837_00477 [bacterium AB1]|nr:hypothetical protein AB837_00477 [bacterium AB1]